MIYGLAFNSFIQPVLSFANWLDNRLMSVTYYDNETALVFIQPIFDWEDVDEHDAVSYTIDADA
jgi:hypothetical protein